MSLEKEHMDALIDVRRAENDALIVFLQKEMTEAEDSVGERTKVLLIDWAVRFCVLVFFSADFWPPSTLGDVAEWFTLLLLLLVLTPNLVRLFRARWTVRENRRAIAKLEAKNEGLKALRASPQGADS